MLVNSFYLFKISQSLLLNVHYYAWLVIDIVQLYAILVFHRLSCQLDKISAPDYKVVGTILFMTVLKNLNLT